MDGNPGGPRGSTSASNPTRTSTDDTIALDGVGPRLDALRHLPGDLVCTLDARGVVTAVGANADRLLGPGGSALVGRRLVDAVDPDDRAVVQAALHAAPPDGNDLRFRARLRHGDGRWRWVDARGRDLLADPEVGAVVVTLRDVSAWVAEDERLRERERVFRTLAQATRAGICQFDRSGELRYANERWSEITGFTTELAAGLGWQAMLHPEDRDRVIGCVFGALPDRVTEIEFRILRPDGEQRWLTSRGVGIADDDGTTSGAVCSVIDITGEVLAKRDAERLNDIFEATTDLVGIADVNGNVLYLNASARRFFGVADDEDLAARRLDQWFPPSATEELDREVYEAFERDGMWTGEISMPRHDGAMVPMLAQLLSHTDEQGRLEFFSAVLHDISNRKRYESQLAHQATHDPLTGLPNRTLLLDRLRTGLERARRHGTHVALLFLDLDHFKVVNDSLGHGAGDDLLMTIAGRLRSVVRPGDTIARFGGDEFVVLCEDIDSTDAAVLVAERITDLVSGAFTIDDADIFVGVSIGIAVSDESTASASNLIRDADAAMYRAKERGRSRWEVFDRAMRTGSIDRLTTENALRRAVDRGELRTWYQPIVSLASGRVEQVEALVRWQHPERGLLPPGEFITVAEETGLIVPMGEWVLDQACAQLAAWQAADPGRPLRVNVNLSGRQLGDRRLVTAVGEAVRHHGVDAGDLELEITESVLMDDVEFSGETLRALKRIGVRLVVDDFGTGYSSLSYLRNFPVDALKVDRTFVDGLGTDPGDTAIVTAVVSLAHSLGLEAVAEGIETAQQLAECRRVGCDHAQGFLMARPGDGEQIGALLAADQQW